MTKPFTTRFIHPKFLSKANGYTPAVEVRGGRTLYISGQVPLDDAGQIVGAGDFEARARQVFQNIKHALLAADMDFGQVVKLGLFVIDMSYLATLRRVRDGFTNAAQPPASTLVQVAGLFHPDILFEAEAIAVAPE